MELTRRGAEVPKSPDVAAKVRAGLVVSPFSPMDPYPKRFKVYIETPTKYIVPVHWALDTFPYLAVADTRSPGVDIDVTFVGALREDLHQPRAVASVLDQWQRTDGAMLCAIAGGGKTSMSLYLAAHVRKKTLVVVHTSVLKEQWRERVKQFLPMASVTEVQGTTCDTTGDVVIAMFQTLASRQYPSTTFREFHLLIVDECHHVGAQVLTQALFGLAFPRVLGLSATPTRKDRLTDVMHWFLGPTAFLMQRENQVTTEVRTVKYAAERYAMPPPLNRRGDVDYTGIVSILVADEARTRVIALAAVALTREGRDVLVLSHRREHCKAICAAVACEDVECATYLGGDKLVPDARVLVATFSLAAEGFDCPRLSALVLATPASDVEQACGRVMRGSAREAVVVDVVDQLGVCFAQAAKRRAMYKRSGFTMASAADRAPPPSTSNEFAFLDD